MLTGIGTGQAGRRTPRSPEKRPGCPRPAPPATRTLFATAVSPFPASLRGIVARVPYFPLFTVRLSRDSSTWSSVGPRSHWLLSLLHAVDVPRPPSPVPTARGCREHRARAARPAHRTAAPVAPSCPAATTVLSLFPFSFPFKSRRRSEIHQLGFFFNFFGPSIETITRVSP